MNAIFHSSVHFRNSRSHNWSFATHGSDLCNIALRLGPAQFGRHHLRHHVERRNRHWRVLSGRSDLCLESAGQHGDHDSSTGALLVLGLGGTPLTPASFTLNSASAQDLPAPVVTVPSGTGTTPTPEPGTFVTLSLACLAIVLRSRRLRESSAS